MRTPHDDPCLQSSNNRVGKFKCNLKNVASFTCIQDDEWRSALEMIGSSDGDSELNPTIFRGNPALF